MYGDTFLVPVNTIGGRPVIPVVESQTIELKNTLKSPILKFFQKMSCRAWLRF